MSYRSRIPRIAAELAPAVDAATEVAALLIAERARARVPVDSGRLRDAIHTERAGVAEWEVVAGNSRAWYGHIVEHGSVRTGPRPFLIPAAEESRPQVTAALVAALRRIT